MSSTQEQEVENKLKLKHTGLSESSESSPPDAILLGYFLGPDGGEAVGRPGVGFGRGVGSGGGGVGGDGTQEEDG